MLHYNSTTLFGPHDAKKSIAPGSRNNGLGFDARDGVGKRTGAAARVDPAALKLNEVLSV